MEKNSTQYTDPEVSRLKFEAEVKTLLMIREQNRRRGIVVLDYSFPNVWVSFAATQLSPNPVLFCVKVNFTNYDSEPLSVEFVNPFSFEPLKRDNIPIPFFRKIGTNDDGTPKLNRLLITKADGIPFFCLQGIREYHNHPQHMGDSWFLHRNGGKGTLGYIIEKLYQYGIIGLNNFAIPLKNQADEHIIANVNSILIAFDVNKIPE